MRTANAGAPGNIQQYTTAQEVPQNIIINVPPQDNTIVWVAGVAVPLLIACVGWWLQHTWRRQNPNTPLTVANYKKSRTK
mgnify:CR=1 FL=1